MSCQKEAQRSTCYPNVHNSCRSFNALTHDLGEIIRTLGSFSTFGEAERLSQMTGASLNQLAMQDLAQQYILRGDRKIGAKLTSEAAKREDPLLQCQVQVCRRTQMSAKFDHSPRNPTKFE